jgi:asparagine synthase (glutamine-hydrolysing)
MALNDTWHPFYQDEEIYYDAFQEHARYLAKNAIGVSFNGLGGDDVVARFDFQERQKTIPSFFGHGLAVPQQTYRNSNDSFARVANQFVMQKFSCNNVYLEQGIWPVAPFTDPRLFLYCQSLKPRYRDNKNIFRMYCQAWGYPESIYQPSVNENFGPFFKNFADHQLQPLVERWLKKSALVELGLINKEKTLDYILHPANDEEQFQAPYYRRDQPSDTRCHFVELAFPMRLFAMLFR